MTDDLSPASEPAPGQVPTTPHKSLGPRQWAVIVVGGLLIGLGIWLVATRLPGWLTRPPVEGSTPDAGAAGETRKIQAKLYYVSGDGTALVSVNRQVLYGATPAEQARRIVEAQVATPPEGALSAIPAGTTVRAVFLTADHEAYVDLGGAIATGHSGGSLNEALAVYAVVNAVAVNLPEVTAVQILIEGKEVDSLAGHIDLRHPLAKALDWVEKGQ